MKGSSDVNREQKCTQPHETFTNKVHCTITYSLPDSECMIRDLCSQNEVATDPFSFSFHQETYQEMGKSLKISGHSSYSSSYIDPSGNLKLEPCAI